MTSRNRFSQCAARLAFACVTLCSLTNAPAAPWLWDLGVLSNTTKSYGYAVSVFDRVVGVSFTSGGSDKKAFRTDNNGTMQDIGGFAEAYNIADTVGGGANEIVGTQYYYDYERPFWRLDNGSTVTTISLTRPAYGTSGAAFGVVRSTTNSSAVGYVVVNGTPNACYWRIDKQSSSCFDSVTNYGARHYSGQTSVAYDTDGTRTIGYHVSNSVAKAFLIESNAYGTSAYDLPVPAGTAESIAFRMCRLSTTNYAVGYVVNGSGYQVPILWSYTGSGNATYQLLNVCSGTRGIARDINTNGWIVGSVWTSTPFDGTSSDDEKACVWDFNGNSTILSDVYSGWSLKIANGINAGAKITGIGKHGSDIRAFLLWEWQFYSCDCICQQGE